MQVRGAIGSVAFAGLEFVVWGGSTLGNPVLDTGSSQSEGDWGSSAVGVDGTASVIELVGNLMDIE